MNQVHKKKWGKLHKYCVLIKCHNKHCPGVNECGIIQKIKAKYETNRAQSR